MADIIMADVTFEQTSQEDGPKITALQVLANDPDRSTLKVFAAISSEMRYSGCGIAYVKDGKYLGSAWSLGRSSRREAGVAAILEAHRVAAREDIMGSAKKILIMTTLQGHKEALATAGRYKPGPHRYRYMDRHGGIALRECLSLEKNLRDRGIRIDIKEVDNPNRDEGLRMALSLAKYGFFKAVKGSKDGEHFEDVDPAELQQAAAAPMPFRQKRQERKRQKREEVGMRKAFSELGLRG